MTASFNGFAFNTVPFNGAAMVALVINRPLHGVLLSPGSSSTPWSIDPERTQQIVDADNFQDFTAKLLTPGSSSTPWSIDPERTQEIT